MSTATPQDVRDTLSGVKLSLEDSDIQNHLDRAKEDNERVNKTGQMDQTQLRRIEELLASIKILTHPERTVQQASIGSASKSYERKQIDALRAELSDWDPSNSLGSTVTRDSDRNVTSTRDV